jgi:hypothetical protein
VKSRDGISMYRMAAVSSGRCAPALSARRYANAIGNHSYAKTEKRVGLPCPSGD